MKKRNGFGLLALALAAGSLAVPAASAVPESTDPIKIAVNEWTGQVLSANITGALLKKMGYNVNLVIASSLPQLEAIAHSELDLNPEVWDNSVTEAYTKGVASGDIVIAGPLGLIPKEGWVYPPYMEKLCPGLPSYKALYDCAQAFGTPETFPKGRIVGYPAEWGTRSQDVVAGIGLPFDVVPGGSEGAMVAELKGAVAAQEPILMMFWQPHWLFAEQDLHYVEWNKTDGTCDEKNEVKDTACGFAQAHVLKIEDRGFATKYPAAAAMVAKLTLTNEEQNEMILQVDQKGRTVDDVVQEWMTKNEAKWQAWVK